MYEQLLGQTIPVPNYSCNNSNDTIIFTLSSSSHSAWNPTLICSLQQCHLSSSNNNSCITSSTLCFDYRTLNNRSYCAPPILCSVLEPCSNVTYACTSNTSVCIVNSCCSPQAVCLPLSVRDFCIAGNNTFYTPIFKYSRTNLSALFWFYLRLYSFLQSLDRVILCINWK